MLQKRRLLFLMCLTVALVLGIMATLIHAQGDTFASTPLNYGDNLPGTLSFTSPRMAYAFVGQQNDLVTVRVSPLASGLDPKVTLLDPNGQILIQNDNGPFTGKPDAFLSLFLPESGFYTLIVQSANGTTGDFLMQLTGRAPVKSHRLVFGVPVEVDVRTDPLPAYFTFKANTDCPTTLTVYDISAGKPYTFPFVVIVRDEDGTPVEQLQGGRMTENRMTVHNQPDTAPTAGLYEVEVTSADPTVAGSLFLVITCANEEPACFIPNGPEGTPTPSTPRPPPPTYDPCLPGELTLARGDGTVVIVTGQDGLTQLKGAGGGDRASGVIVTLSRETLTPSPTIAATPCPTQPPCLSPLESYMTEFAPTRAALLGTAAAGGLTYNEIQATSQALKPVLIAKATEIAGEPNPCEPPTVTPCPTQGIQLRSVGAATATAAALQAEGCATPVVTPCATSTGLLLRDPLSMTQIAARLQAEGCATPVVTPCATDSGLQLRTIQSLTEQAATLQAEGCNPPLATETPTCEPPLRTTRETEIAAATAYARDCQTPTPTPTCPPNVAGAVVPCNPPAATPPCPTPDRRANFADIQATAAAIHQTEVAGGLSQPDAQSTNAIIVPTLIAYLTQQAQSPCSPSPTPTCPPFTAAAVLPCQQTPTPSCTPIAGIAVIPCQPGCPTPGVGDIAPENPNQASAGDPTPAGDLGILVLPTPCATATATPTATRRPNIPQGVDCANFALTSPTDGLPNGGITVYWNPAPGATAYRVSILNDANVVKASVVVPGNVTSVGMDVSEGAVGPGYTFTIVVQAIFNGKVGCSSAKTENRAATNNNNGNGDRPKPTCSPLGVTKPNC